MPPADVRTGSLYYVISVRSTEVEPALAFRQALRITSKWRWLLTRALSLASRHPIAEGAPRPTSPAPSVFRMIRPSPVVRGSTISSYYGLAGFGIRL